MKQHMKGTPIALEQACVQKVAEKVDLDGFICLFLPPLLAQPHMHTLTLCLCERDPFGMLSNTLSGGMKRRLSLGISLIGDPSVVVNPPFPKPQNKEEASSYVI